MSSPSDPQDPAEELAGEPAEAGEPVQEFRRQSPDPEPDWKRRQRLAAVFGESGPEQTADDHDAREDRSGKGDDWYREQVPPHHG